EREDQGPGGCEERERRAVDGVEKLREAGLGDMLGKQGLVVPERAIEQVLAQTKQHAERGDRNDGRAHKSRCKGPAGRAMRRHHRASSTITPIASIVL